MDQSGTRGRSSVYISQLAPSGSGSSLSLFTEDCVSLSGAETVRMSHWGRKDQHRAKQTGWEQAVEEQSRAD